MDQLGIKPGPGLKLNQHYLEKHDQISDTFICFEVLYLAIDDPLCLSHPPKYLIDYYLVALK